MSRPNAIAVKTALVKRVLVPQIVDAVEARMASVAVAEAFDPEDAGEEALALARAGYATRVVEHELFEPARRPAPGLAEDLLRHERRHGDRRSAVVELSRELAATEPPRRPDPHEGTASWRVPGPGGHVRHYVALELGRRLAAGGEDLVRKRNFMFGFFLRCCEESAAGCPDGRDDPRQQKSGA
jgi:hypothetical protein